MRSIFVILFTLNVASILVGNVSANLLGCVASGQYNSSTDYFPDKAKPNPAAFTITYTLNTKTINNAISNETIILYQCGTPAPQNTPNTTKVISVPVNSIAVLDTTAVTFLELLGARTKINTTDSLEFIVSACVQALGKTNAINSLNSSNTELATSELSKQDLVLQYLSSSFDSLKNAVAFTATTDKGSLNRVQYLDFVGAFLNQESASTGIKKTITDSYNCIGNVAKNAQKQVGDSNAPVVAFTTYNAPADYNNNTASWTVSNATYKSDYVTNAGGKLFNPPKLFYQTAKELLDVLTDVDIVIEESAISVKDAATFYKSYNTSASSSLKFIKNKQVYQFDKTSNPNGGNDWFESAIVYAHIVLADFTSITYPGLFPKSSYTTKYLTNILADPTSVSITSSECASTGNLSIAQTVPAVACPTSVDLKTITSARTSDRPSAARAAVEFQPLMMVGFVALVGFVSGLAL